MKTVSATLVRLDMNKLELQIFDPRTGDRIGAVRENEPGFETACHIVGIDPEDFQTKSDVSR